MCRVTNQFKRVHKLSLTLCRVSSMLPQEYVVSNLIQKIPLLSTWLHLFFFCHITNETVPMRRPWANKKYLSKKKGSPQSLISSKSLCRMWFESMEQLKNEWSSLLAIGWTTVLWLNNRMNFKKDSWIKNKNS